MQKEKVKLEFYELLNQRVSNSPNKLSECPSTSPPYLITENPFNSGNILTDSYSHSSSKLLEVVLMWVEANVWVITPMRTQCSIRVPALYSRRKREKKREG